MKCTRCKGRASVALPRHHAAFCAPHFLEHAESQVRRAIKRWGMLSTGEGVMVAVSGGKDSLALWEVLNRLGYRTEGLHIHLGIGEYSDRSLEKAQRFAEARGLPLHSVDLRERFGLGVPELARTLRRVPCSGCGLSKRYVLNREAVERGFSVVATGHNLDDEAATLLGNALTWQTGAMQRQSPVLESTRPTLARRVKPLVLLTERETASYALLRGIDYVEDECPHAEGAASLFYKGLLNTLEGRSPGARQRFLAGFLDRMRPILLEQRADDAQVGECSLCGQPTTAQVCSFCRMWERALGGGHPAATGAPGA